MAKYHINKQGIPAACRARTRPCPLGGDNVHFETKEQAQSHVDKENKKKFGTLASQESRKTLSPLQKKTLENLTDALNLELDTKKYTLKPYQRDVVYTLTNGYHTRRKLDANLEKLTNEGLFNVKFNDDADAEDFLDSLNKTLGTPEGTFYYERVALNNGNKTTIPGFSFMGMSVKGVITENRLFMKVD